jgi:hypothetical protein
MFAIVVGVVIVVVASASIEQAEVMDKWINAPFYDGDVFTTQLITGCINTSFHSVIDAMLHTSLATTDSAVRNHSA